MRRLAVLLALAIVPTCAAPAVAGAASAPGTPAHDRMIERQARKALAVYRHPERRTDVPRLAGEDADLNPILREASTRRIAHGRGFDGYLALNAHGLGAICLLLVTPADTRINHVCGDDVPKFLGTYPNRTAKLPDGRVAVVVPVADGGSPAVLLTPDQRLLAGLPVVGNALAAVVSEHEIVALLPFQETLILVEAIVPAGPTATWAFLPAPA